MLRLKQGLHCKCALPRIPVGATPRGCPLSGWPAREPAPTNVAAFTLIELIMTMVIVGIIAIPLSLTIREHVESVFISERDSMAENLARFEMEKVNNMNYANIASDSSPNYLGYGYDVTRTATYIEGNAVSIEGLKQIQVNVEKSGETGVLFSLTTYMTNHVTYNAI